LPKDRIPLLKNDEVVCYKDSASNMIDTFRLDVRNIWHQDTEGGYLQYIEIYYNKSNLKETLFSIYIGPSGTGGEFSIFTLQSQSVFSSYTNYFIINGITYPNVYVIRDNRLAPSDTIPNKVYFTYTNGIIRYEYTDGRVYELISK